MILGDPRIKPGSYVRLAAEISAEWLKGYYEMGLRYGVKYQVTAVGDPPRHEGCISLKGFEETIARKSLEFVEDGTLPLLAEEIDLSDIHAGQQILESLTREGDCNE